MGFCLNLINLWEISGRMPIQGKGVIVHWGVFENVTPGMNSWLVIAALFLSFLSWSSPTGDWTSKQVDPAGWRQATYRTTTNTAYSRLTANNLPHNKHCVLWHWRKCGLTVSQRISSFVRGLPRYSLDGLSLLIIIWSFQASDTEWQMMKDWSLQGTWDLHFYRPPTKLYILVFHDVFSRVCHSVQGVSHVTTTHDALVLTIQGFHRPCISLPLLPHPEVGPYCTETKCPSPPDMGLTIQTSPSFSDIWCQEDRRSV